jgi:hypothetical protein
MAKCKLFLLVKLCALAYRCCEVKCGDEVAEEGEARRRRNRAAVLKCSAALHHGLHQQRTSGDGKICLSSASLVERGSCSTLRWSFFLLAIS